MGSERHKPEEIVTKLQQVEILVRHSSPISTVSSLNSGRSVPQIDHALTKNDPA